MNRRRYMTMKQIQSQILTSLLTSLKYIKGSGLKTIGNFTLEYHLHIIIFILSIFILFTYHKTDKEPFLIDTKYIKDKFLVDLSSRERLTEKEVKAIYQTFESNLRETLDGISKQEKRIILKKPSVISGGIDITKEVCESLEIANCSTYSNAYSNAYHNTN